MSKLQRYSMGDHWNCFVEDDDGQVLMGTDVDELEAKYAQLEAINTWLLRSLTACLGMIEDLQMESDREIGWGNEDKFRMGEWFDVEHLTAIEDARAAIAKAKGEQP